MFTYIADSTLSISSASSLQKDLGGEVLGTEDAEDEKGQLSEDAGEGG